MQIHSGEVNTTDLIDEIKRSKRKTISIEITKDARAVVHAPMRTSLQVIERIVKEKEYWIRTKKEEAQRRNKACPKMSFAEGGSFLLLGAVYTLHFDDTAKEIHTEKDFLVVPLKYKESAGEKLASFYKKTARSYFTARTDYFAAIMGVHYETIRITSALTRWGSCSSKGTICYTWRLIMASSELTDYVVVHELCHLLHMNHSAAFWRSVARVMPDFDYRRNKLKGCSALLHKDIFNT